MKRKLIRTLRFLLLILIVYGAFCLVLASFQRSMIYFPTRLTNPEAEFIELDRADAMLRIATHLQEGERAILYFGGNGEDVSYSIPELQNAFPDSAIYAMHYRGYSGSSGSPSEAALHSDAKALYDLVIGKHSKVVVVGRSLGSGIAIRLAAENPVHRIVLITPFDSLLNVAKFHYPLLPIGLLLVDRYQSDLWASKITTPTLILIAEHDQIVPRRFSESLADSFPQGVCQSIVIPGTDHNSLSLPTDLVRQFVNR